MSPTLDPVNAPHSAALHAPTYEYDASPTWPPRDSCRNNAVVLPRQPQNAPRLEAMLGRSAVMLDLREQIRRVAASNATVLISGETGTGKELVAHAVHDLGVRRQEAFVALNCGAVPAALIESELFGHERGSFTGANRLHHGVFAQAARGTLFLDEITEMHPDLQVRLLRVLEDGTFQRLGGEQTIRTDARIIAATNRDPAAAMRSGQLREDLYYRLRVFPIVLPPLRARDDDILLLAQHFLADHNHRSSTAKVFAPLALHRLRQHSWPGNVRELAHFVHHAWLMADHELDAAALPVLHAASRAGKLEIAIGASIADVEQQMILATLAHCEGDKKTTAAQLGISLKTLYCRLNLYSASAVSA